MTLFSYLVCFTCRPITFTDASFVMPKVSMKKFDIERAIQQPTMALEILSQQDGISFNFNSIYKRITFSAMRKYCEQTSETWSLFKNY